MTKYIHKVHDTQDIKYIDIHASYRENKAYNYRNTSIDDHLQYLNSNKSSMETTRFEVIPGGVPVRIYFDIEAIPKDQPNIIYDIISSLKVFLLKTLPKDTFPELNTRCIPHALTHNKASSSHEGLSYHLFFPTLATTIHNIEKLLKNYLQTEEGQKYTDYCDTVVYSSDRLFKCIEQIGISKKSFEKDPDDRHVLVEGNIIDTVIQYIPDETIILNYEYDDVITTNRRKVLSWTPKDGKVKVITETLTDVFSHLLNPLNNSKLTDDYIYIRFLKLSRIPKLKPKVEVHMKYYIEHNHTFSNYIYTLDQLDSLANVIQRKYLLEEEHEE